MSDRQLFGLDIDGGPEVFTLLDGRRNVGMITDNSVVDELSFTKTGPSGFQCWVREPHRVLNAMPRYLGTYKTFQEAVTMMITNRPEREAWVR